MGRRAVLIGVLRSLPVLALAALLFAALYLSGLAAEGSEVLVRAFPWILAGAALAVLVLLASILRRLWRLLRDWRRGAPGAALTVRLVAMFVVLAVPPLLIVYGFAQRAVSDAIRAGVDQRVEATLSEALAVAQSILDQRRRDALAATRSLAAELAPLPAGARGARMDEALDELGALELALFETGGRVLEFWTLDFGRLLPELPEPELLLQAAAQGELASAESLQDRLVLRALVRLPSAPGATAIWLQLISTVPSDLAPRLERIEREVHRQQTLAYLRVALQRTLSLILGAVLLLAVLMAILAAFSLARRLVAPVARLAMATRELAEGRVVQPLPEPLADELGFLVRAFNAMVRQLGQASARAQRSAEETEAQRAWLQTLLQRLSSGVIGLDAEGRLRTVNSAATAMFGPSLAEQISQPLERLPARLPAMAPVFDSMLRHAEGSGREWREELRLDGPDGGRVLMLRAARLPAGSDAGGWVVLIDDMTVLNRAQRDAAWAEVARRLAHEIKNPLTPIQLAAERLRRKYLGVLPQADAEVLDRSTHTIVAQVEALKQIVNEFSEYARPQPARRDPLALDALLAELVELWGGGSPRRIELQLEPELPLLRGDAGRLRQLVNNLLRNAEEAVAELEQPRVLLALSRSRRAGVDGLQLSVADNGPGVPAALRERLFEPYTTSKARGTGLGLAICRRIAEEHGGSIELDASTDIGARFVVWLPLQAG